MSLDGSGKFAPLGAISSSEEREGFCETSCVDWYGNTRAIFLGERIFALIGNEVQEVEKSGSEVRALGTRLILSK